MKKENNQLTALVQSSGVSVEKIKEISEGLSKFFEMAGEWSDKIETIIVTDSTQKREMKLARESRLLLRGYRLDAEKNIKEKRDALKHKMADDILFDKLLLSANKMIKATFENLEMKLEEKEKFAERYEAEQKALLLDNRLNLVLRYLLPDENLDKVKNVCIEASEDDFNKFLIEKKQAYDDEQKRLENVRRQNEILRAGFTYDTTTGGKFCFMSVCITVDELTSLPSELFDQRLKEASVLIAEIQQEQKRELEQKHKENIELRAELAKVKETPAPTQTTATEPKKSGTMDDLLLMGMSESEKLKFWVDSFHVSASPVASATTFEIASKFTAFKKWALQLINENVKA
ncbi:hypothetical protein UFOVP105_41 [uncultured Caudovirales phage]|uniref:Uncharacterized protein n=1 Tax=uncultured Caudovirales phage TaxID=2100421 RepID=A0A6J5L1A6_9CAUD|nr:hypothetical protein UFOVP105_41 [uncultured Caudovirales phage]